MARANSDVSLDERVASALARAAEAREHSRIAIDIHVSVIAALRATVAEGRAARARRAREGTFAFGHAHARKRSPSG
jgi:hypothetical protein